MTADDPVLLRSGATIPVCVFWQLESLLRQGRRVYLDAAGVLCIEPLAGLDEDQVYLLSTMEAEMTLLLEDAAQALVQ